MWLRKHGPDLRKIRLHSCYSVHEAANLLRVSPGTVRAWIRRGLPVLEGCKLILIPGDGLKAWLKARRAARKQTCQPYELYCCRCRGPRKAKAGSVLIVPRNAKTVAIRALCASCDAKMNRGGSLAKLSEIEVAFGLVTPAQVSLAQCENPAVNQHFDKEPVK
jgi:excisionase family DNA binding protein